MIYLDTNDTDTGPLYIVKHSEDYLTVEDMQRIYQGRWLNDQVTISTNSYKKYCLS